MEKKIKPLISICIPVYNQLDLLKWNLESILKCKDDRIQIVVSDNNSSDNIEVFVKRLSDSRIKYCSLPVNKGHDGNIINAFMNCDADYAFLLRTRDSIIPDKIETIISFIRNYPQVAYMRFSAVGEDNTVVLALNNAVYKPGVNTAKADYSIPIHPSGELYNLRLVEKEELERIRIHVEKMFPLNDGFLVHILLRHLLVPRGLFLTSSVPAWYYADINKAQDRAVVNMLENSQLAVSPYSPSKQFIRFECEIAFVSIYIQDKLQKYILKSVIKKYAELVTLTFRRFNNSEGILRHYNCAREDFSLLSSAFTFLKVARSLFVKYAIKKRFMFILHSYYCVFVWLPFIVLKRRISRKNKEN